MKITIICAKSKSILWYRRNLISKWQELGHAVSVIALDDECEQEIKELNVDFYCVNDANRSLNPFKILTLSKRYSRILKKINPDLVFTFMLKPNIYGVQGAKKAGITNVYSMVEGAGDVFIYNSLKWKLIRFVACRGYKKSFDYVKKVFFLNNDDKNEFVERGIVKEEKCEIVHGVGVDIERFSYTPLENYNVFLMISRLSKTKGIIEYCEAAKYVKEIYSSAIFNLVGPEGEITREDLRKYTDNGVINYLGETTDVRPFIKECSVHVLPSYREGLGLVNAEAGAVGRPSITGNTNGTRDTVKDGYNGLLVPIKDFQALAEKMIYFLENPDKIDIMGQNARKYSEEMFDQRVINEKICKIIGAEKESAPV